MSRLAQRHIAVSDKVLPQGLGPVPGAVPVTARAPLLALRPRRVPDSDQVPVPVPGVVAALAAQARVVAAVIPKISRVEPTSAHVTGVKAAVSAVTPRVEAGAKVPGDGGVLGEVVGAVAGGTGEATLVAEGVALIAHGGGGALVLTNLAGDHAALLIRNILALSPKIK